MTTLDNSAQKWNRLWANRLINFYPRLPASRAIDNFVRRQLHFKAIDKLLGPILLEGKDILELGSGTGSNSFYLAKNHNAGSITLVDFSEKALSRVKKSFYNYPVTKIQEDLLLFSPSKKYDFVHSTGLVEHFTGKTRLLVIKKHAQYVPPGGLIMVWVPIFSPAFTLIGKINHWLGIEEIPFTKDNLKFLFKESNLEIVKEGTAVLGSLYGILARKK